MDGQLVAVAVAVAASALYVARSARKAWRADGGCGSGCGGCSAPAKEEPAAGRISLPQV